MSLLTVDNESKTINFIEKAKKIIHDKKRQELEYYDVWMEMAGLPVMYTPYFWHPDPTVKRGFMGAVKR